MQGKREIDVEVVVGSHELNTVPLSLFHDDGSMIDGVVLGKPTLLPKFL